MKLFNPLPLSAVLGMTAIALCPMQVLAQTADPAPVESNPTCLTGYPDGSFQGDRQVTRYEFAAGLNACIEQMLEPLQNADLATQGEFEATLQRQRELNEEIRELNGQLDSSQSDQLTQPE